MNEEKARRWSDSGQRDLRASRKIDGCTYRPRADPHRENIKAASPSRESEHKKAESLRRKAEPKKAESLRRKAEPEKAESPCRK